MIKIICGPKGSGKTKMLIEIANDAVATAKGHLVFITDTKRYMYDLKREIRFIDVTDYSVAGEDALCGFVKGTIAGSYDNSSSRAAAPRKNFPISQRNICNIARGGAVRAAAKQV